MRCQSQLFIVAILFCTLCLNTSTCIAQAGIDTINYNRGTFFGKSTNDSYLLHMAVDAQGYIYGTGFCTSIVTTSGVYQPSNAGQYDVMVFKMDPTMKTVIWATYIGGSDNEGAGGIAVSASGEVYVSGYTSSANFPVTVASDNAYLSTGTVNIFALKLSSDGSTLLYSRILGRGPIITQQTAVASKGAHIAINPSGEAYVFSHTTGTTFQLSANAYQSTNAGSSDFTLTKLASNGAISYATFFGGSGTEIAYDICYSNGKVYCTGSTSSAGLALRSGKVPDASGDCCVFVADDNASKVQPRKAFVYGTSGGDQGLSVCYDARANRVCLTGVAGSTMAYTTTLVSGQSTGGFLAAIDTALNALQFVTMIGGSSVPTSITTRTTTSTIYSAGYVSGTLPISANAYQAALRGSMDGFMVAIDSVGSRLRYGSYIGGSGNDYSAAKVLLVDRNCLYRIVFGITTHSPDFPTTTNTYQPQKLNGVDDQPAIVMFSSQPSASLQYTTRPCNTQASFTLTSSCPLSNIVWTFGDGGTLSGVMTATHNYPSFGSYLVRIRGLTSDGDTVILDQNVLIGNQQLVDAGPDQVVCKKTPIAQLNASGAATYRWSPGKTLSDSTIPNPIAKPEKTTTYVVYGKDSYGCESWDSVTIVVRDLKITADHDTTICEGRFAQLRASGADLYSWYPTIGLSISSGPVVLASPPTSTAYTVIGYNGVCYDTSVVSVIVNPRPRVRMATVPGICANTPVQLDFAVLAPMADSDIVSVQWSPTQNIDNPTSHHPIVTPSKDGWYKVTVISKYGCVTTDSVFIPIQNKLSIAVSRDTTVCEGNTVQLHANGAAQYEWFPADGLSDAHSGSPVCTIGATTRYRVIGHGGSCVDTQYVTVRISPLPTVQKALGDTTICVHDRVHLWVNGGDSSGMRYAWYPATEFENSSGASVYLSPADTGVKTYTVIMTNAFGCSRRDSVKIHVQSVLQLSIGPNVRVCPGEKASLLITSATDAATAFTWTPNDGVWNAQTHAYDITVSQNKTYHVHAQRGSCFYDADFNVAVKDLPNFQLSGDTALCYGSVLQLAATSTQSGISYRWMNGNQLDTSLDNALSARPITKALDHDLQLRVDADLDGCTASKTLNVHVYALPQIALRSDTTICAGDSLRFSVTGNNLQAFHWSPSQDLSSSTTQEVVAKPSVSTVYTVDVLNTNGCSATAQFRVGVQPHAKLYFRVLSVNNDKALKPGDSTTMSIAVWSDSTRSTPLDFDVRCNAMIFQPDNITYKDIQDQRFMHVHIPMAQLLDTERVITSIHGLAMQAAPASSIISIENIEADPALCSIRTTAPSLMSIVSCFNEGRNITYQQPLAAVVSPNPNSGHAQLTLQSSDRGLIELRVLNTIGQIVRSWNVGHNSDETNHSLDLEGMSSGSYTLVLRSATGTASLRILKVD